jgi:putative acetyltransferase
MDSKTIQIRRSEPDDYRVICEIFSQPNAIRGTLQIPFPSAESWRKRLADQSEDRIGLVACIDGEVVGDISLVYGDRTPRRRHVGQLGIVVHDDWQGRGIGTALMKAAVDLADRWLNLNRLELTVYTDNRPAIALYEKYGFDIEGTLRRYAYREGSYVDAYAMARLRPAYGDSAVTQGDVSSE